MTYIFFFLISLALAAFFVPLAKKFAVRFNVFDLPGNRKIHTSPTPLLGGLAIFLSFAVATLLYCLLAQPNFNVIPQKIFVSFLLGGFVLVLGGVLDDKYNLPPKALWLFPALASLIAVAGGIGSSIHQLTNPFGQPISLDHSFSLFSFHLSLASVFSWIWLMGMIFTTKFLDGLDGLCSGIAFIGGLTIFALSLLPHINQPITASLAIILCGSVLGFLFFNFNPASIFLGESGSTFLGFALGVLSIILGGKRASSVP
jgi:UDP-GlcNAc:undecaprenyl-phosphate GlcNAc-1-phosphate transferase